MNSHDFSFVLFQIISLFNSVMDPIMTEERQPLKKQKKKRRGNRQQQRYRAKLRKEGLIDATINHLLAGEANLDMEQEQQENEIIDIDSRESLVDQVR
jgi:hypothetical protein